MLLIQNLIFFNIVFFIGRGLFIFFAMLLKKDPAEKLFGLDSYAFYPLITFFVLGNFSFILNFFLPIKNNFVLYFLLIFIVLNFKRNFEKLNFRQLIISNFTIPIVLSVSSYSVGFHYDAALYHLNTQGWIISEKIVLGLSNIYLPLGFSTINEYVLANFWINENFIYHHFVNLAFLTMFYSFMYHFIFQSGIKYYKFLGIFIIAYGFLDNFGINGGNNGFVNIQGIGKVDNNFAIVFFLTSIFFIHSIKNEIYIKIDLLVLSLLTLFAIQMKIYGYGLFVFYFYYLINFIKTNENYFKKLKVVVPSIILGIFWLLRSYLKTGCLIYPIDFLCFSNLTWHANRTNLLTVDTREFHNALSLSENLSDWFIKFSSKEVDFSIFLNFIFSYGLIILFFFIFFNKVNTKKELNYLVFVFTLTNLLIYFFSAPTPRFFIGLFMFIISIPAIYIDEIKINNKMLNILLTSLFFITVGLTPRVSDYMNFLSSPIENRILEPSIIEYQNNEGWGVRPVDGEQCWINIECTEAKVELDIKNSKGYKIISEQDK